jgi:hypothetical protein
MEHGFRMMPVLGGAANTHFIHLERMTVFAEWACLRHQSLQVRSRDSTIRRISAVAAAGGTAPLCRDKAGEMPTGINRTSL